MINNMRWRQAENREQNRDGKRTNRNHRAMQSSYFEAEAREEAVEEEQGMPSSSWHTHPCRRNTHSRFASSPCRHGPWWNPLFR